MLAMRETLALTFTLVVLLWLYAIARRRAHERARHREGRDDG